MKTAFLIIFSLISFGAFSQSSQPFTQEKASAWLKVVDDPAPPVRSAPVPKTSTTVKKKSSTSKPSAPKEDAGEEFEKTNNQVNRFKKQQKG